MIITTVKPLAVALAGIPVGHLDQCDLSDVMACELPEYEPTATDLQLMTEPDEGDLSVWFSALDTLASYEHTRLVKRREAGLLELEEQQLAEELGTELQEITAVAADSVGCAA
ncbi:MAG: hypothetical protein QOG87_2282 [Actinomycetota bacterium]|jgi:hypothetical protein